MPIAIMALRKPGPRMATTAIASDGAIQSTAIRSFRPVAEAGRRQRASDALRISNEGVRQDLSQKIEDVREDLTQKIEGVREDLTSVRHDIASMKVWAMGLYFALAGSLLFVMAKGFKWL